MSRKMINKIKGLTEKVSDNFLIGVITLDSALNSSSVPIQGVANKDFSPNYVLCGGLLALGATLVIGSDFVNKYSEKLSKGIERGGYFVLGAAAASAFI